MTPPSDNHRWPALLAALGLLFIAFSIWAAVRAATGVSAVTDRNYYSHGLRYDDSVVERRATASAGWRLKATFSEGQLEVRLRDRDGRAVADCRGEATLADGSTRLLREEPPGLYHTPLETPDDRPSTVLLRFERDGASFSRRLLLNR